jgi:signal transduction histidine kinase
VQQVQPGRDQTAQEREQALQTLVTVSAILAGTEPFDEKAARVLTELARLSGATEVILRVPDQEARGFRLVSWVSQTPERSRPDAVIPFEEGLSSVAHRTREPIITNDYVAHPQVSSRFVARGTRSAAFIPILFEGEAAGVLALISVEAGFFTEERVRVLTSVAASLGVLLETARLAEERRLRTTELETLYAISSIASSQAPLQSKIEAALRELTRVSQAAIAVMRTPDAEGRRLELVAAAGPGLGDPFEPLQRLPADASLTGKALRDGHVVVSNDYQQEPEAGGEWVEQGVRSAVVLPLVLEGRSLGVISIGSFKLHGFPPRLVRLLTTVGYELGGILQNARLNEEVRLRSDALQVLSAAARPVVQSETFAQRAAHILAEVVRASDSDLAAFRVPTEDGQSLSLAAAVGRDGREISIPALVPMEGSQTGVAFREKRAVISNDLANDDRFRTVVLEGFVPQSVRAALSIPVQSGERMIGAMLIASQTAQHFTPNRVRLLTEVGASIGTLIENARLYEDLRQRSIDLAAFNKELEAFSYSVSHDLRSPLVGIDGFSQALMEDYGDRLDDTGRHYLDRIRAGTERLAQIIDDLLALSRVNRTEVRREEVDLSLLASAVATELRQQDQTRQVEFAIAEGIRTPGDQRLLRVLFENLLGNAWKFTSHHAQARIEFGAMDADGQRVYYVRDDGAGFDPAYADKLFVPLQRLHTAEEFPGTGIGLATVERVVRRHGGRIWAEGAVERGACFYFTLG